YGGPLAFTATVTQHNSPTPITSGNVAIGEGSCGTGFTTLASGAVNGSGQFVWDAARLSAASHTLRACYLGFASGGSAIHPSTQTTTRPTITAKELTASGLSASTKVYDGNTTATVTGTPALVGKVSGDTVNLGGSASGSFANKNVGPAKSVSVSGLTISG